MADLAAPALAPPMAPSSRKGGTSRITLEELQKYFQLPIVEVAKEFQVCTTLLKKICRQHGIVRWPHRQIRSIGRSIKALEAADASAVGAEKERIREQIRLLETKKQWVVENASAGGTVATSQLKAKMGSPHALRAPYSAINSRSAEPSPGSLEPQLTQRQKLYVQQQQAQQAAAAQRSSRTRKPAARAQHSYDDEDEEDERYYREEGARRRSAKAAAQAVARQQAQARAQAAAQHAQAQSMDAQQAQMMRFVHEQRQQPRLANARMGQQQRPALLFADVRGRSPDVADATLALTRLTQASLQAPQQPAMQDFQLQQHRQWLSNLADAAPAQPQFAHPANPGAARPRVSIPPMRAPQESSAPATEPMPVLEPAVRVAPNAMSLSMLLN